MRRLFFLYDLYQIIVFVGLHDYLYQYHVTLRNHWKIWCKLEMDQIQIKKKKLLGQQRIDMMPRVDHYFVQNVNVKDEEF